jgi:PAS domain S-box-containing protein/putative nucleotidyltransferase with HDIG domain
MGMGGDPEPVDPDGLSSAHSWALIDAVTDAVMVTDPGGSIVHWNPAAEVLLGWMAAEAVGRSYLDVLVAEERRDAASRIFDRALTSHSVSGEFKSPRRDGTVFDAQVTISPVRDDRDRPVAVVIVTRDVTTRRIAAEELDTLNERRREFLHASGDVYVIVDANGVVLFIDGPVSEVYGLAADQVVGADAFEILQPEDRDRARSLLERRLSATGPMPSEEFWLTRPDGRWACVSVVANNRVDDPHVQGIILVVREITEGKRLELARDVLTGANVALISATTQFDLFDRICNIIVDDVAYHLAWIGISDTAHPLGVRMVASAAHAAAYVDALESLTGDTVYRGPLAQAIETRELQIIEDVESLPEAMPWRRLALDFGIRSLVAIPLVLGEHEFGVLAIYSKQRDAFSPDAVAVLQELANDVSYGARALKIREQRTSYRLRFEESLEAIVRAMATATELRDPYTAGHQHRVSHLAMAIANEMGLDPEMAEGMGVGAAIHDIGKLAVPAEILSRPDRLSPAEWSIIKEHPEAGYKIVSGIDFPWPVAEMIRQHHERLDGSGYPRGLRGEEIATGARVIMVADVVEAIQSHRPYRPSLGLEAALREIEAHRGTLYDPTVVDACLRLFREKGYTFPI